MIRGIAKKLAPLVRDTATRHAKRIIHVTEPETVNTVATVFS